MKVILTYFAIYFNEELNLDDFCAKLGFAKEEILPLVHKDKIVIGENREPSLNVNECLRTTLKDLFGKEDILYQLKQEYGLDYYLAKVVYLTPEGVMPILSLEGDIVEFLYLTEAIDDLDYYIYWSLNHRFKFYKFNSQNMTEKGKRLNKNVI